MHHLRHLCAVVVAAILMPAVLQAQDIHKQYTKEHPLVYEDAWDLWPYVFLDDDGNAVGYNIDLLTLIFEDLDIPFVAKLKPTSEALQDLQAGKSDLMCGMKAKFHDDYTENYSKTVIHIFTHSVAVPENKVNNVHQWQDLSNNKVIVHAESFSHHLMEENGWGDNAHPYNDMDKAIQKASAEGDEVILWNTMSLKWLIYRYHAYNLRLEPVNMPFGEYCFMSNDHQLLKLIDESYARLAASDKLVPLQNKWFYPERETPKSMPSWIWFVVAATGLLTLFLIVFNIALRLRERKATMESSRSNARLLKVLRISHVGLWTYHVSKKTFTLYKEDGTPGKYFTPSNFGRRYSGDDFLRLQEAIRQVVDMEHQEVRTEVRVKEEQDTEAHTYDMVISVLRKYKGRPAILIGTRNDITKERERQQMVKDIHSRYQSVFATALIDMIYFDSNGRVVRMNERAQRTFKMTTEEAVQRGITLKQISGISDLNFNNRDYFYATIVQDANDSEHSIMYYELQLMPVYDATHTLLGIYGTGLDITDNVKAYHDMKNSLERLHKATNTVTSYVDNINYAMRMGGMQLIDYSVDTHTLTIYKQMNQIQYVLTQTRCISLCDEQSRRVVQRLIKSMDNKTNHQLGGEIKTIIRLNGNKYLHLQVMLFPQTDAQGNVTGYSGLFRDVSDIKETEELLQKETAKAQEVETVKDSFLRNMCYEIRTPLNTVVGFAELFNQEHNTEDEEVFIDEIKENSAYLLRLINDILFLSRLDAHMIEINPQPCDFSCTFEAHCQMGWNNVKKDGVKYIIENPYNQLIVNIDDANLGRVIEQLTCNAAEHTDKGSVYTRYDYISDKLVIAINDTGSGISDDVLSNIFERFGQGSTKGGTGLGLPICKELVDQQGGTIDINTEVGKGTSIWVTIPCKALSIDRKKEI